MKAINIEECLGVGVTHMLIPVLILNDWVFSGVQSHSGGITCTPAVI